MESIDPLISVLQLLQADANNREAPESISYIALNNALQAYSGGINPGAPSIDDVEFAKRFEAEPILQQFVDGYDKAGIRLKTNAPQQPNQQDGEMEQEPSVDISGIAKQTAKRRLKK